jgi:hypothetical protein
VGNAHDRKFGIADRPKPKHQRLTDRSFPTAPTISRSEQLGAIGSDSAASLTEGHCFRNGERLNHTSDEVIDYAPILA